MPLKGKAAPCPIVSLTWSGMPAIATTPADDGLTLEIQATASGLKVSASEPAVDPGTVKTYEEVTLSSSERDALVQGLSAFMHPSGATSYRTRVSELGAQLFGRMLPAGARERLQRTVARSVRLQVDDALVHIPWELLHDGKEFFGLRFAVGRMVAARARTSTAAVRGVAASGPAVVVADASGDLKAAAEEGRAVAGLLKDGFGGPVRLLAGPTRRRELLTAVAGCRLLHVAGHAERTSADARGGFRVADGVVTAVELADAMGTTAPALVFANSCHASTEAGWIEPAQHTASLAAALLLKGVGHYLAPMWEIPDQDALGFALRFYEQALAGVPFGEAVRVARLAIREEQRHVLSFAGYVLYGDPRARLEATRLKRSEPVRGAASASGPASALPRALHPHMVQTLAVTGGLVAAALVLCFAAWQYWRAPVAAAPTIAVPVVSALPPTPAPAADPARHTGPLRVTVLPFKNLSTDERDATLKVSDALQEAVLTDILGIDGVRVVEHAQIDVNILYLEDSHSKHYDPTFMAELGKLKGAEVVVLGAYQRLGAEMRANARLVSPESGEILDTVKVDRRDGSMLKLQDALAAGVRVAVCGARAKLRPTEGK